MKVATLHKAIVTSGGGFGCGVGGNITSVHLFLLSECGFYNMNEYC